MTHVPRIPLLQAIVVAVVVLTATAVNARELPKPTIVETNGLRFGVVRPAAVTRPAPTLIFLSTSLESTFNTTYGGIPRLAHDAGWIVVSLDVPGHGRDIRGDEFDNAGMYTWRARLAGGENIVETFTRRLSAVVTLLVASGDADASRVFVGGISRGGFMALHAAAADPRIAAVVALAPVTELDVLMEFIGSADTSRTDVSQQAAALAGRPVWITIGTHDDRVDTAACLRFAEAVASAAARGGKTSRLELHVRQAESHTYPSDAEPQAAAWLQKIAGGAR
jgi:poly(3-hydroxybutyrate) depolymerase